MAKSKQQPRRKQPTQGRRKQQPKRKQQPGAKRVARSLWSQLSPAGKAFLKCAFAPPDFTSDPGMGIPDRYNGKTFMDKACSAVAVAPTAGNDTYYLVAPTPGIAFWTTTTTTGTPLTSSSVWTPVLHSGYFGAGQPLFGGPTSANTNVDKFRYASLAAGFYTTSSAMTTAGSVQVWKMPLTLVEEYYNKTVATTPAVTFDASAPIVAGLDGSTVVPRDNYSQGVIHGMYTISTNNQEEFRFLDIHPGINRLPSTNYTSSMWGVLNATASNAAIVGVGDLDAICIKVSVPTGASVSGVLKSWACIEFRTVPDSIYDRLCSNSPDYDPIALALYRQAAKGLPLAVMSAENANFWQRLLEVLGIGAAAAAYVPGPVGIIGAGASMLISGMKELSM